MLHLNLSKIILNRLFYVTLFVLCLGQFVSLSKESGLNIYVFDIFVGIFMVFGLLYFMVRGRIFIPRFFSLFSFFLIFALITLVSTSLSLDIENILISGFYLFRLSSYIGAGLVVANMLNEQIISKKSVEDVLIVSGIFLLLTGVLQLIFLPDFTTLDLEALGWDPHKNRLAGSFFDPNFMGAYLVIIFALILNRILTKNLTTKVNLTLVLLFIVGILLTFSRSSWIMLSVVILVFGLFKNKKLILVSVLAAFLAYFAVPRVQTRISGITDPSDSAHFRLISWSETLEIAKENPFFGVGFNAIRYAKQEYGFIDTGTIGGHSASGADSSLLLVFATTGLIGLFLYLLPYLNLVWVYKNDIFLIAVLSSLFVHSLFVNSLFYPQIMFLVFCLVSLKTSDTQKT